MKLPLRIAGFGGWIKDADERDMLRLSDGVKAESDLTGIECQQLVDMVNRHNHMLETLIQILQSAGFESGECEPELKRTGLRVAISPLHRARFLVQAAKKEGAS